MTLLEPELADGALDALARLLLLVLLELLLELLVLELPDVPESELPEAVLPVVLPEADAVEAAC